MSDESDLAHKVSTEIPWWASAPVWLAAGIVGVPSLIALAGGYFIAQTVQHQMRTIIQYNLSEIHLINEQNNTGNARWENIRNLMRLTLEVQIKTCIHEAKDKQEQKDCLTMADHTKLIK